MMVNNSERGEIIFHMAFDLAIEDVPGIPSELIVPDTFRNKLKRKGPAEIERLSLLMRNGTISSEEFEAIKLRLGQ